VSNGRPVLCVDVVVCAWPWIAMIRRSRPPYPHHLALPGGKVNPWETADQAAMRELQEETGLVATVHQLRLWSKPDRDPRGWYVSMVYWARAPWPLIDLHPEGDDVVAAGWHHLDNLEPWNVAFDHYAIIHSAARRLRDLAAPAGTLPTP
jgi:ADP-ribose pyrophosphatase YjhB (NUDIX family)